MGIPRRLGASVLLGISRGLGNCEFYSMTYYVVSFISREVIGGLV